MAGYSMFLGVARLSIRLIAIDLDGTLLDHDLSFRPESKEAIAAAVRRGITVTLATGRMYQSAAPWAEVFGLSEGPLIVYNGALVRHWPNGRTIFHRPVEPDLALLVAEFCRDRGIYLQAYFDDNYYVPAEGEKSELYRSISGVKGIPVGGIVEFLDSRPVDDAAPTKLLVIDDPERLDQVQKELHNLMGERVYLTRSFPFFLEILAERVSKGAALRAIAKDLEIQTADIMAIGDNFNDLPMIEAAGVGVAVAGAPEKVRVRANYVTRGEAGDGVTEAIRRFALEA